MTISWFFVSSLHSNIAMRDDIKKINKKEKSWYKKTSFVFKYFVLSYLASYWNLKKSSSEISFYLQYSCLWDDKLKLEMFLCQETKVIQELVSAKLPNDYYQTELWINGFITPELWYWSQVMHSRPTVLYHSWELFIVILFKIFSQIYCIKLLNFKS